MKYLNTVPKEIWILFGSSFTALVIKFLWLNNITEFFSGGAAAGVAIENILFSVLASCIFWFIVFHIKNENDRENVIPYVRLVVYGIAQDCLIQLHALRLLGDNPNQIKPNLDDLTKAKIAEALKRVSPMGIVPDYLHVPTRSNATWLQFMDTFRGQTKQKIEALWRKITFLDSALVQTLAKLEDCLHFAIIGSSVKFGLNNTDMAWATDPFYDYCLIIKQLIQRANTDLASYEY